MAQQEQSHWRSTRSQVLWTLGIVVGLTAAVLIGYRYGITLWDWIKLLIVPAVIAGGGIWFNRQQRERELEIASHRAQDEALQAYLDQMSAMLLPQKDQPSLYDERPPDSMRTVARARTLTVLPRLDGDRKARVVQFLYEAGLLKADLLSWAEPILSLRKADLRGALLIRAGLRNINLGYADLREADLSGAYLYKSDLRGADLRGATLREATLVGADLLEASLTYADLSDAILMDARLDRATMPDGQPYEEWLKSQGRGASGKDNGPP